MKAKFVCLALALALGFFLHVNAQTCPPNLDFEKGDFSNWECFTGNASVSGDKNLISLTPSSPSQGRHEIITSTTKPRKDPYGNFPVFCPYGGNYSVKLGNENVGGEAEGLSYTFTVPSTIDTFTFTYYYAVVFQDPAHSLKEQPRFFVTAYDVATQEVINCASYDYVANGTLPGFQKSALDSGVLYKTWSPTSLQFAGMADRKVRLEFKTADCTLGGHFGYAYVDVGSGCSNILATAPYCKESNSLILNAPYGYKSYTWYNEDFTQIVGDQQSITFSPAPATSGVYNVDVVPYPGYGCRDTLYATVKPLPFPDLPSDTNFVFCQNTYAPRLDIPASPGNDIMWYVGDTLGIGTDLPPLPPTSKVGTLTYFASQKTLFGCESFRKKVEVHIVPMPVASLSCDDLRQCQNGNFFVFKNNSTNQSKTVFNWDFGDGVLLETKADTAVNHVYKKSGNFQVTLKVTNEGTCTSQQSVYVTVVPKPIASFSYPETVCEKQTVVTVIDQSSVPGGVSFINKWWWDFNGAILQTRNPSSFIPGGPIPLTIKLVATTNEGCISDTTLITMPVRSQPKADFSFSGSLCNNEIIQFKDLSSLPANAAGESIVKWSWKFVNYTSALQNPALSLDAGTQHAQLIAESNYGCKSNVADNEFTVHAKPTIALDINDSCVFRNIRYKALDLKNTVNTWHWDFGTGLKQGTSLITRSYTTEGYRPLTLIGQTIYGCKDTVIRPFTIYDNKAFAGRDTITAMGEPVQMNAKGGTNNTYLWSPAVGLNNSTIENPVATLDYDQVYQLDAVTKEGCDSHSKILIRRYKGPTLYIPTAFTPNNDGKNDVLHVFPVGIKAFHYMAVYSRQGELLFRTTSHSKGWDGRYKGAVLGTQTFVVVAEAIDYKGKPMLQKQTVTLIR